MANMKGGLTPPEVYDYIRNRLAWLYQQEGSVWLLLHEVVPNLEEVDLSGAGAIERLRHLVGTICEGCKPLVDFHIDLNIVAILEEGGAADLEEYLLERYQRALRIQGIVPRRRAFEGWCAFVRRLIHVCPTMFSSIRMRSTTRYYVAPLPASKEDCHVTSDGYAKLTVLLERSHHGFPPGEKLVALELEHLETRSVDEFSWVDYYLAFRGFRRVTVSMNPASRMSALSWHSHLISETYILEFDNPLVDVDVQAWGTELLRNFLYRDECLYELMHPLSWPGLTDSHFVMLWVLETTHWRKLLGKVDSNRIIKRLMVIPQP